MNFSIYFVRGEHVVSKQVLVYLRHPNIVTVMGAVLGSAENDDTQEPLMVRTLSLCDQ
jgi:hypothetical protein